VQAGNCEAGTTASEETWGLGRVRSIHASAPFTRLVPVTADFVVGILLSRSSEDSIVARIMNVWMSREAAESLCTGVTQFWIR